MELQKFNLSLLKGIHPTVNNSSSLLITEIIKPWNF